MFQIHSEYFTQDDSGQITEPDWEFMFFNFLTVELKNKLFKHIGEMTWNQKYFYLGLQYEFGIDVEKNFKKALKYYFKGFYQRNSYCCYKLYFIYRSENINFKTKKNKDLAILFLLISAAYYEFNPINHKMEPKLYFAINLDLEDFDKEKIFAILNTLKYSPLTESEILFLRSWINICFNKNFEELKNTLELLSNSIETVPFEHSIFLLANFFNDPFENIIERNLEKASFYFKKLENSSDPVILYGLGKFYSNINQYEKALNFMRKSFITGFNAFNGFVNVNLCYLSNIRSEEYQFVLKSLINNLILGDCNVLADLIAFLKYIKIVFKQKEKLLETEIKENSSLINNSDILNKTEHQKHFINLENPNKSNHLIEEITLMKKLYKKYSFYFFSFIHFNEDFLKLNKFHSLNYLINIPYFLMNSFTKGSFNGIIDLDKVNSIANNVELQAKVNERHRNYLLMLAAKNTNKKKDVIKYFLKYKEFTKDTFMNNYLQCYTLFEFDFYLKNIKNAYDYLAVINSKNSLNSELNYSNMETFFIQEKVKLLLNDKNYSVNLESHLEIPNKGVNNSISEMKNLCIICMDNQKVTIFVPCGHKCCCEKCAEIIYSQKKQCPICTMIIEHMISKIYD